MDDPLRIRFSLVRDALAMALSWTQFADNVLSRAMNGQDCPALEPPRLACGRRLEWLGILAESGLDDSVSADTRIDSPRDSLHLWQFGHGPILRGREEGTVDREEVKK